MMIKNILRNSNCLEASLFHKEAEKFSSRNPFNKRNKFYEGIFIFNYKDLPECAIKKIN